MPPVLRRIWIQVTADRRRFSVLCAVCAVGLLLWGRLIIVSKMPRTAVADQPAAAPRAAEGESKAADKSATKVQSKSDGKSREPVEVRLWSLCERDPFVISREHFPKLTPVTEVKPEAGKLPTEPAEDATQTESRRVARLTELLGTMKLEAAMGTTMAVIDGKQYRVGEQLPALGNERVQFTLVEVRQRSVVMEFQGRRFDMQMSLPGT